MLSRESEELDMPPPHKPNTTILKIRRFPGHCTAPLSSGESSEEITEATPEGNALLEFLLSFKKEPKHDYPM